MSMLLTDSSTSALSLTTSEILPPRAPPMRSGFDSDDRPVSPIIEEELEEDVHATIDSRSGYLSVPESEPGTNSLNLSSPISNESLRSSVEQQSSCVRQCNPSHAVTSMFSRFLSSREDLYSIQEHPAGAKRIRKNYERPSAAYNIPSDQWRPVPEILRDNSKRRHELISSIRTVKQRTIADWKISRPTNFKHLTHAGSREFSNLTDRSQNDLIADFSAIRASQNSCEDLRGINVQALGSKAANTRMESNSNNASETSSLHSNDVPSLASESSRESLNSPQGPFPDSSPNAPQNASLPSQAQPSAPTHKTNYSFSRPFRNDGPRTRLIDDYEGVTAPVVLTQAGQNDETYDTHAMSADVPPEDVSESCIGGPWTPESELALLSFTYSPAASFAVETLDVVHEVNNQLELNPAQRVFSNIPPQPLRLAPIAPDYTIADRKQAERVVEDASHPSEVAVKAVAPLSRPGSGASGSTITPRSLSQNEFSSDDKQANACLNNPSSHRSHRKQRSTSSSASQSAGLFSAWGLDDDDDDDAVHGYSGHKSKKSNQSTATFGSSKKDWSDPLNGSPHSRISSNTGSSEFGDEPFGYLDQTALGRRLARKLGGCSRPSLELERRKHVAMSNMNTIIQRTREPVANPLVPAPLTLKKSMPSSTSSEGDERSDLARSFSVVSVSSSGDGRSILRKPGSMSAGRWTPILYKDIENKSNNAGGMWKTETLDTKSIPDFYRGVLGLAEPSTTHAKTVHFKDDLAHGEPEQIDGLIIKSAKLWEKGSVQINVTEPVPHPLPHELKSNSGRRWLPRRRMADPYMS